MEVSEKGKFKQDKGVAGLTILLTVVAMVFIIGFLVTIFAIIGGNLQNSTSVASSTTGTVTNASTTTTVSSNGSFAITGLDPNLRSCTLTITNVLNQTDNVVIGSGNYSASGCSIVPTASVSENFNNTFWNVTGSYNYLANTTATESIADTTRAIAGVTTWFPIIITITVMVALILLTVIIIVAIRSSGIMAGGSSGGRSDITA